MHGPHKPHLIAGGSLCQLLEFGCFLGGIGFAPAAVVIGIILGAIDIGVELIGSIKVKLPQSVGMAPRIAIEALHHASVGALGPVGDLHLCELALSSIHELEQGLDSVECTFGVVAGNDDLFGSDTQIIAFSLIGNERRHTLHGFIATATDSHLGLSAGRESLYERCHGVRIGLIATRELDALRSSHYR